MATRDEIAGLDFDLALVVLEFFDRDVGFGLQAGVDDHEVVVDADDFGGDDFADAHFLARCSDSSNRAAKDSTSVGLRGGLGLRHVTDFRAGGLRLRVRLRSDAPVRSARREVRRSDGAWDRLRPRSIERPALAATSSSTCVDRLRRSTVPSVSSRMRILRPASAARRCALVSRASRASQIGAKTVDISRNSFCNQLLIPPLGALRRRSRSGTP